MQKAKNWSIEEKQIILDYFNNLGEIVISRQDDSLRLLYDQLVSYQITNNLNIKSKETFYRFIFRQNYHFTLKNWSENQIQYLILHINDPLHQVAKNLNKRYYSVVEKIKELNLQRDMKLVSSNSISKRNVTMVLDQFDKLNLNKENVIKESEKYKYLTDFKKESYYHYLFAKRHNFLNEISNNLIPVKKFSTPQILLKQIVDECINENGRYNDRTALSGLEIDIYYPNLKLGFEYNGVNFHTDNLNDEKKIKLCKKLGINLIVIEEKTKVKKLYPSVLKNELIDRLDTLSNYGFNSKAINDFEFDFNFLIK